MPFDQHPQPILDPSVRDLLPRQRLERLQDWLYAGGPGEAAWDFYQIMERRDCGTVGCAAGWYFTLVHGGVPEKAEAWFHTENAFDEFGISEEAYYDAFVAAGDEVGRLRREVTPRDVANVIDLVLRGEIQ